MMKRLFDIVAAAAALVLLSPVLLILALLVRFNLGDPILFRQQRPGLNGFPFQMFKFRSMLDAVGASVQAVHIRRGLPGVVVATFFAIGDVGFRFATCSPKNRGAGCLTSMGALTQWSVTMTTHEST